MRKNAENGGGILIRRHTVALLVLAAAVLTATESVAKESDPTPVAPYANMQWREMGPASPGRVTAVAGSATNYKLYYVGAAGGGVWKTENAAQTWTPVFDQADVASIGAIALDPTDDNTVWVGTGEDDPRNDVSYGDGVYKSIDGGKTWSNVGLAGTKYISRILIDPKDHDHVLVGAQGDVFADSPERGVYVTDDGGKSWRNTLYVGPMSGISDLALDLQNPSVVYAGVWQFRRQPWTFQSGGPNDGLYKSTDGGNTWAKLTGGGFPTDTLGRIGVSVAPSDGNRVYALIESKQGLLWRSDDGGARWTMMNDETIVDQRPFYFTHIETDPKNPNLVYSVSEALSVSEDGGKTFTRFPYSNEDYHQLWIAPDDPSRMMVAADGQYSLTLDGGANWFNAANFPIGQVYHIGLSRENPYGVCAGFQDGPTMCAPSNSQDPNGILNKAWIWLTGGDGQWAVPDPVDPRFIWADTENGALIISNKVTKDVWLGQPYIQDAKASFDNRFARYRFNWESPIAFAPWNGHIAWIGGNCVFQTADRGMHWSVISPDLTRDDKTKQQPSGGPVTLDVSGAEQFDTILDIEGSTVKSGEIWVGTDDGLVQMTRDGGIHWSNATPPNGPRGGRYATVAPSSFDDGTAYAIADAHYTGDNAPYVFVTHDFGRHWDSIANGLPPSEWVRTIRPDIRDRDLLYLGTEQGIWISFDAGRSWQNLKNNMPSVSVRDIRIQPEFDDLVVGTHGRSIYVMDDLRPIQDLQQARAAGTWLFQPRVSYEYSPRSDEWTGTNFTAANPPSGVIISFYQRRAQNVPPKLEILESNGRTIKTIDGSQTIDGKEVSNIPNEPGINRYVWDFSADGPIKWKGAANPDSQGSDSGPQVPPGAYVARLILGGRTFLKGFQVKADPQTVETQAQFEESFALSEHCTAQYSVVDTMLNNLDAITKAFNDASSGATKAGNTALLAQIAIAVADENQTRQFLSADYKGPEDFVQRPGALREDLQYYLTGSPTIVTPALRELEKDVDGHFRRGVARYNDFVAGLPAIDAALRKANLAPLPDIEPIRIVAE
jgi:photosystem II stability/assembly factor-like uncharacterized protein